MQKQKGKIENLTRVSREPSEGYNLRKVPCKLKTPTAQSFWPLPEFSSNDLYL
jgi:hypothetical protein